jgi:YVTN family beta-propeller protein
MLRILPFALVALIAVSGAQGDGCTPSTCGTMSGTLPGGSILAVRTGGQTGRLLAYDLRRGAKAFALPPGMLAADGRHFFTVRAGKTETTLGSYDPQSGAKRNTWSVRGAWLPAAVSPNGRRVLLVRYPKPGGNTRFALVDTARGNVLKLFQVGGPNEVETLSPDGRRVYLVHWRGSSYQLMVYDVARGTLRANPPVSEDGSREKMTGTAWIGIPSHDGRMVYTLYVKADSSAFIHALDLTGHAPHCIDLPGRTASPFDTGMAALVLSPDGRKLYVASPRVGQVAVVDTVRMKVIRTVRFKPAPVASTSSPGAISGNGRTLYFAGDTQLWAYDTAYGRVRGPYALLPGIVGAGFAPNGRKLYLVDAAGNVVSRNAATGKPS